MKFLVSACLTGRPCRYNGTGLENALIKRLREDGMALPFCPETSGGLPVPRSPAEIRRGDGGAVWDGQARVVTREGDDVTNAFKCGAQHALSLARSRGATMAVLVEKSPSCGVRWVHDGSFTGKLCEGEGVTTAWLARHGIKVIAHDDPNLEDLLRLTGLPR